MALLAAQSIVEAGLNPAYAAAAAGGDSVAVASDQRTFLHVKNGSGSNRTVTVTAQQTSRVVPGMGALTRGNIAVVVPANSERFIGPIQEAFRDGSGVAQITYDGVTTVTIAALRLDAVT
jgi:hypothetical protein